MFLRSSTISIICPYCDSYRNKKDSTLKCVNCGESLKIKDFIVSKIVSKTSKGCTYIGYKITEGKIKIEEKVCVKKLSDDGSSLNTVAKLFNNEKTALEKITIKHGKDIKIAKYLDYYEKKSGDYSNDLEKTINDEEYYFLISEYIEGKDLGRKIDEKKSGEPLLYEFDIFHLLQQVTLSLQKIHESERFDDIYYCHLDIKPGNIILIEENNKKEYYLIDFGSAAISSESGTYEPRDKKLRITPQYAAPELDKTPQIFDRSSDFYSLGIMALRLVINQEVPNRQDQYQWKSWLKEGEKRLPFLYSHVIKHLICEDPKNRYTSEKIIEKLKSITNDITTARGGSIKILEEITDIQVSGKLYIAEDDPLYLEKGEKKRKYLLRRIFISKKNEDIEKKIECLNDKLKKINNISFIKAELEKSRELTNVTYYINVYYLKPLKYSTLTLKEIIKQDGKIGERKSINILLNIAKILKQIHDTNIYFITLRTCNIFFKKNKISLIDIGCFNFLDSSNNLFNDVTLPSYYHSEKGLMNDCNSDMFALGVVAICLLQGENREKQLPTQNEGKNKGKIFWYDKELKLNKKTINLIDRLLSQNTGGKVLAYSSMTEVIKDLKKVKQNIYIIKAIKIIAIILISTVLLISFVIAVVGETEKDNYSRELKSHLLNKQ